MFQRWPKRDLNKHYYLVPNEVFNLGLSSHEIAVYNYLLRCEDRRTYQCHPSYRTIGRAVQLSENTVRKYVAGLEEKGLIRTEPSTITTKDGRVRNGSLKLFDQTLLRSSMEAYFDMGGCEYLESRIDATEYGELLPTVDDAVCGLISILDAMNTGDNDRFHLETLHHSKQEIRRIQERGGKIDRTVEYAVDDEEEEYEQYHGFSMRM